MGNGSLRHVNLSFNELHPETNFLVSLPGLALQQIPGSVLSFPAIPFGFLFSVSNNNLTGEIPTSICNATFLQVLDLSSNSLAGSIPPCLPMENWNLGVLSLGRNNFSGNIPDTFSVNCSLKTLDLNRNVLKGKIPASLVNCPLLEVLNIGNNGIEDTFPRVLMNTSLRVLILRSNKFYGDLQCSGAAIQGGSNLQIIDISTNNFGGDISLLSFSNWKGMISGNENQSQYNHLRFDYLKLSGYYYQDAVTVTMKGLEMELTKILVVFTSIDFSRNKFHGSIPHTIGDLKSSYLLNLSHNALTGLIPTPIGNLRQLGSLDLSVNHLTGKIPQELASLTFLSFLNLSFNRLFGKIPQGSQFQTFSAASYEGIAGLCGFPVNINCNDEVRGENSSPELQNGQLYPEKEIEWSYISAALGFAVGLASTIWLLLCCERWRKVYFEQIDRILLKIFPHKDGRKGRVNINQVRRP
ncbi:UNVERIFIED_CONTAM: Receptor-like protein 33 [Sesamum radiatum]|uniref:Receptor-like protein 33 n=1 Tax=Sesamum radiatum TaxID=300843 RepID=A0AAW2R5X0_SESRA